MNSILKKNSEKLLLKKFHEASKRVPAYNDFLKKNKVRISDIKTIEDYKKFVPFVDKDNYLRTYPLKDLVWDGSMYGGNILSLSSGSSGEPYVWLRDYDQRIEAQKIYHKMYKEIFDCADRSTLLVVCFSMGTWIAGSYTSLGAMMAGEQGLPINTINPALDLEDAAKIIDKQHSDYEQIIIAGYPPLIKDLIDLTTDSGIDLKKLKIKYTLAGEQISEELRKYILDKGTSYKSSESVINIYGTADAGILSHETPMSIKIRQKLYQDGSFKEVFDRAVLPSLHQFDPRIKYLEQDQDDVIVNSYSGIPLFRYKIKDKGGIIDDPEKMLENVGSDDPYFGYPAVYVHGREDFTVSLYAVLIYPENIKDTLIGELADITTGRFVMNVNVDKNQDQHFNLTVEQRNRNLTKKEKTQVHKKIIDNLIAKNREFAKLYEYMGDKVLPNLEFVEKNSGIFAKRSKDNKQKWVE